MDISLKNETLKGIVCDMLEDAYCPGEGSGKSVQLPGEDHGASIDSPSPISDLFFGTSDDWGVDDIGPKIRNQIIGRLMMELRAGHVKRLLSSPGFGDFQPDYTGYLTPQEAIDQAEAATRLIHEVLTKDGDYVNVLDNYCGHIGLYSHTMKSVSFHRQYEMRPMEYPNIDAEQLMELQERGFEPEMVEPFLIDDPEAGVPVEHYSVRGQMRRDVSRVEVTLARYEDILLDKKARSQKELVVEGISSFMTRQQALDRFSNREDGAVDKINKYFGDVSGKEEKPQKIYDAVLRIQEEEDLYLIHAVVLGDTKDFLLLEQIDDSPWILDIFMNLPNSLEAVSLAERIRHHQNLLTDLIRNFADSAFEASRTKVYTTGKNVMSLKSGRAAEQKIGIVDEPERMVMDKSAFAGDVMPFFEYMIKDGEKLVGHPGEIDAPSIANLTVYASEILDESRALLREYMTTMIAQSIRQDFERTYRLVVNNIETRSMYSPEQGRVVTYDLTQWPRSLRFESSVGFGRGSKSTNLLNKKEVLVQLLEMSASPLGAAIVTPENVYTAAQDYLTELGADAARLLTKYEPQPPEPTDTDKVLEHQREQMEVQTALTTRDQDFTEAMQTAELELKADEQKHEQQMDVAELSLKMGDREAKQWQEKE